MCGRRLLIQSPLCGSKENYHDGDAADYCDDIEGDEAIVEGVEEEVFGVAFFKPDIEGGAGSEG